MKLHEKLYQLRKEKGLTQAELAERLEVSRQSVSNWEVGTTTPSTKRLRDLSQLYDVPLDYLLNEDSPEKQEEAPLKEEISPEAKDNDKVTEPVSERPQEGRKQLWIAVVIALGVVLLVLSVAAVVHRFDNKEGDDAAFLNELSDGEIQLDSGYDFSFD